MTPRSVLLRLNKDSEASFQEVKTLQGKILRRMPFLPDIPDERRYPLIPIIGDQLEET